VLWNPGTTIDSLTSKCVPTRRLKAVRRVIGRTCFRHCRQLRRDATACLRSPKVAVGIERTLFRSPADHSGRSIGGGVRSNEKRFSAADCSSALPVFCVPRSGVRKIALTLILQLYSSAGVAVACARIRTTGFATHCAAARRSCGQTEVAYRSFKAKLAGPAVQSRAKARQNRGTAPSL
jgi:hypothetical protein